MFEFQIISEKQITAHQQAIMVIICGEKSIFFTAMETIVALFIKHMLYRTLNILYKRCPFIIIC